MKMKIYKYKIILEKRENLKSIKDIEGWFNLYGDKGWRIIDMEKNEKSIAIIIEKDYQKKEEEPNPELNDVIELFNFNPSYTLIYPNKNQRKALETLIKEKGKEKVIEMIKLAGKSNGDTKNKAPTITTPIQLANKWIQLENYIKRVMREKDINFCRVCKKRVVSSTDGMCNNCWEKQYE